MKVRIKNSYQKTPIYIGKGLVMPGTVATVLKSSWEDFLKTECGQAHAKYLTLVKEQTAQEVENEKAARVKASQARNAKRGRPKKDAMAAAQAALLAKSDALAQPQVEG